MAESVEKLVAWAKAQYDKVVAIMVLVVLVMSLLYLAVRATMVPAIQEEFRVKIDSLRPQHEHLVEIETQPLERAYDETQKPFQLEYEEWTNALPAAAFVPESRVWCVDCKFPIPYGALICPFCRSTQPDPTDVGLDSDSDGMPDDWEEQYRLDPLNAADAKQDEDEDGFSNISEFKGKTNPRDKTDFPPVIDIIQLVEIKRDLFHLKFVGKVVLPDGSVKFQLNTRRHTATEWVPMEGTTKDGFKVVGYEEKKDRVDDGTMERIVDISELTLERDAELITLVKGFERPHPEYLAVLRLELMGKDPIVREAGRGKKFRMEGKEYKVIDIDKENEFVLIRDVEDGTPKKVVK